MQQPNQYQLTNSTKKGSRKGIVKGYSNRSLLCYPGGKTRARKEIIRYFPKGITQMLSPFLGGGSIELEMAAKGVEIFAYDVFKSLVEFWQCLTKNPKRLADHIQKYHPLSKNKFCELKRTHPTFTSKYERAAIFYALNRSSFSGTTFSGGISVGHPRFTPSSIERVRQFYNPNIHVQQADFKTSLKNHPDTFAYLAPPYIIDSYLYENRGSTHKNFDHKGLSQILKQRKNWILSYNDCPKVRALYVGHKMVKLTWRYSTGKCKRGRELLVFSKKDMNILKL